MRDLLSKCKNMTILEDKVTLRSSVKGEQLEGLILPGGRNRRIGAARARRAPEKKVDQNAMFKLSYGLFLLTAKDQKDNGCIINTVTQITDTPKRISIAVNKLNLTHDMIARTGKFNLTVLSQDAPFKIFEHYGFHSGRDVNKFEGHDLPRTETAWSTCRQQLRRAQRHRDRQAGIRNAHGVLCGSYRGQGALRRAADDL